MQPCRKHTEGRGCHDYLALAGACFFAAISHGPVDLKVAGIEIERLPPEQREFREERFSDNLIAALQWYSQMAMWIEDGDYDKKL